MSRERVVGIIARPLRRVPRPRRFGPGAFSVSSGKPTVDPCRGKAMLAEANTLDEIRRLRAAGVLPKR